MDKELEILIHQIVPMTTDERLDQAFKNATANALISFNEAYRANLKALEHE